MAYTLIQIIIDANETCTKCPHCEFMGTKADLETHISKQDGFVAICGECGKTFDETQSCEEHIETAHVMPQQCEPFPCDECGLVLVCYNFQKNVQK